MNFKLYMINKNNEHLRKIYHILRVIFKVNWFKTVRLNFGILPFNQAMKFPILVTGKLIIDSLKGKIVFDCPLQFGLIIIGKDFDNMPISTNPTRILIDGLLIFKGKCVINHSTNLVVWPGGKMQIGRFVRTLSGVLLKSTYDVLIGDYTRITSGCFVMDSNIHLVKDIKSGMIGRVCKPIKIGKACWIGMNSSILGGTILPDFSITSRYTFLNKDYSLTNEPGTMFAGSPARAIKNNVQRLYDLHYELELTRFFMNNPDINEVQGNPGFEEINDTEMEKLFRI